MTQRASSADTAFEVADRLRLAEPWEVFAERSRRYEIHLNGGTVEMVRGPIELEGFALRVFRFRDGNVGIGFQASTDLSDEGVRLAASDSESLATFSQFPAKTLELPGPVPSGSQGVEVCDAQLWDQPMQRLEEYVHALLASFDGKRDVVPSFGSVRATLAETTLGNSAGLRVAYPHTSIEREFAVKALEGPEGSPPGEYWVNDICRRLDAAGLPAQVEEWCAYARDARRAALAPTGELPVLLPPSTLVEILPPVIGSRWTGVARLREMSPPLGEKWGWEELSVTDDGRVPWGVGSSPVDDEGSPRRRTELLSRGEVTELLYDVPHAGAFDTQSTGNAARGVALFNRDWRRFLTAPVLSSSTLIVSPGKGGTDAELIESVGDGLWVQQLGAAFPNPYSGAFGGELRMGYRIRHGKLAEPVRGGTVGGFVAAPPGRSSLLSDVVGIGSTPSLVEGVHTPTLLIRSLTVAGR
jgi:PmbA protein